MEIFKRLLSDFTDKEKFEISLFVLLILVGTVLVLLGISWSRGRDVDYFKEKIYIIEERLNHNDKRDHDQGESIAKTEARISETEKDVTVIAINVAATQNVVKDIINPPNKKNPTSIPPFEKLPPLPVPKKSVQHLKPLTHEEIKKLHTN